jgi:hypothetical protein
MRRFTAHQQAHEIIFPTQRQPKVVLSIQGHRTGNVWSDHAV